MPNDHGADPPAPHAAPAMSLNRRMFLALLGAGGTAALNPRWFSLPAAGTGAGAGSGAAVVDPAFPLGVASGDPLPDGTVIWTSVDPAADTGDGVAVRWEVAADESFSTVVASGTETATTGSGHTIHAVVSGLDADGWYHYRFTYGSHVSRSGRLRTAPAPGASPDRLRFTFSSCQQINDSSYVAHAAMAAEDLDFVVHYGDYVYVSDDGTLTVDDYRGVYRRFKANPYLQELHARYPMVVVWDDGEFVNGIDRTMEPVRFAAARQAWFEFMPVVRPADDPERVHRAIEWGSLVDFTLLDVRSRRDEAIQSNDPTTLLPTTDTALPSGAAIFDPDRTCLGADQKAWLSDRLVTGDFTWRHIGHGYPFVALRLEDYDTPEARANPPEGFHVNGGKYLSTEQWDGYWAERRALMDHLADHEVPNVVVTSGHTHIFFASGLRPDFDDLVASPVVAKEFVCGSLTADPDPRSQYFPDLPRADAEAAIHGLETAFLGVNPHVDHIDLLNQGYGLVTFTPTEAVVDLRVIDTFDEDAVAVTAQSYRIGVGELPWFPERQEPPIDPVDPPDDSAIGTAPGASPLPGSATYTG